MFYIGFSVYMYIICIYYNLQYICMYLTSLSNHIMEDLLKLSLEFRRI